MVFRERLDAWARQGAGRHAIALGLVAGILPAFALGGGLAGWQTADIQHELELEESATQLALSPDGTRLASAEESTLKVWEVASGRLIQQLDGHRSPEVEWTLPVTGLAFSPDGSVLASTSWNPGVVPKASLKLWDPATGKLLHSLAGSQGCREVGFTADGESVWAACGRDAQRYSLATGEAVERAEQIPEGLLTASAAEAAADELPMPRQGPAHALALSEAGEHLAWAGRPATYPAPIVRVWRRETDEQDASAEPAGETATEYLELDLPGETVARDPVTLAREHYSRELPNPVTVEQIEQRMLESGEVRVMLTLSNLKDDALRAWRYRLTFEPREESLWELVRVERKHQCWRGPTEPEEWTTQLCI
ncbi:MAG TPA: hypothetical protein VKY70_11980 [Pseudomonas sp.]|nr:hypothetical protein [Pseudomonas sp.]